MAGIIKLLCVVFFVSLMSKGTLQCYPGTLTLKQVPTGVHISNKPEWRVIIANECLCTQSDAKILCAGFQTVEQVDPKIFAKSGDTCVINNEYPIYGHTSVNFTYAWDNAFAFGKITSQENCS
ncbi:uncharacterized protein LOC132281351 [Cornus florida]|uniref:uncharacterized protein LOC132281351 n=1 Tax=Cornus florida TaxID=4283 RepID=UPI00289CF151|nr:uncharacterized protein LOC132281351 [Cornus florida]